MDFCEQNGEDMSPLGPRPIFVIGDSRTGTTSMHNFFQAHGLRSIHYFIDQAAISSPIHLDYEENERKFLDYLAI